MWVRIPRKHERDRRPKHRGTPALTEDDGYSGKGFNLGQRPIRTGRANEACSWLGSAQITLLLLNSSLIPVRGRKKFPGINNDDRL